MKRFVKKLSMVAAGAVLSASASAEFIPFYLDPDGAGTTYNPILVNEFIGIAGNIDAVNTYTGPTSFTFSQSASNIQASGVDGLVNLDIIGGGIGANLNGTGTGDIADGTISFTGGTINLFAGGPGGSVIGSFNIESGGGAILPTAAPNGVSTIVARAQSFAPGYFFTVSGGGVGDDFSTIDLATVAGDTGIPLFGFSTTNLSIVQGTGVVDGAGRLTSFTANASGQFRLETVPVPATLALMGLGMLGLAGFSRRRRNAA